MKFDTKRIPDVTFSNSIIQKHVQTLVESVV